MVTAWTNLLAEEALLRAQHQSPSGVEIRRTRAKRHRVVTEHVLTTVRPGLDRRRLDDLIDTALLMTSSRALFELIDVIGIDAERGATLAARAMVALLNQA